MKRYIFLIGALLLLIYSIRTNGQTLITKNDSIPLEQDTIIQIVLPGARGNIQWQKSLDSENWINLEGETKDTLVAKSDLEAIYRAEVTDGTCLPVISDSVAVITLDSIIKNYVDPVSLGLNLISDSTNISIGNYIYTGTDNTNDLEIGKVIIDEQSGGTIRIITEISHQGDTVTAQTDQATMEDLFIDESFNLSTEMIYPSGNLKSATLEEIGKLLTDEEGFIHPIEIIDLSPDGSVLKSTSIYFENKSASSSLFLHVDWDNFPLFEYSGKFEAKDTSGVSSSFEGNVKAYISEGYFTLDPELKFEFSYTRPKIRLWPPKVSKGKLNKFKFYMDDAITDIKNVVVFESDIKYELKLEKTLKKDAVKKIFKFAVGPVPVWINVNVDIKSDITVVVDGESVITQGFQNTNNITLGAGYENQNWNIIKDFETENHIYITNKGYVHSGIRFDIYPEFDIKFYSVAGPEMKIGPYVKYDVYRSFAGNWDKSLDLGLDAKVGASVKVLGTTLASLSETSFNLYEKNLWSAPEKLSLVTGNSQSAPIYSELPIPIKVKVTASNDNPLSNVWVHFHPLKGEVSENEVRTDEDGFAQTNWTLSGDYGEHTMNVYFCNGKDEKMDSLNVKATSVSPFSPGVTTNNVTDITKSSAITGGKITYSATEVISRGVCWNKTGNPTLEDNYTEDGAGKGGYTSVITELVFGTEYFVRAYGTNLAGTSYGNEISFMTMGSVPEYGTFTDIRDGKTYKTVVINGQEWMAENLAYLPVVNSPQNDNSITEPFYYVYGSDGSDIEAAKSSSYYTDYGVLYNWPAATAACPLGWHLPGDSEWAALISYLGGESIAGGKMKESETIHWLPPNSDASNISGFSGLPGGYCWPYPSPDFVGRPFYKNLGEEGYFWSSTGSDGKAGIIILNNSSSELIMEYGVMNYGYCVRCIKD